MQTPSVAHMQTGEQKRCWKNPENNRTAKFFLVTFIDFGNYMVTKMLPNTPFYLLKIMMAKRK